MDSEHEVDQFDGDIEVPQHDAQIVDMNDPNVQVVELDDVVEDDVDDLNDDDVDNDDLKAEQYGDDEDNVMERNPDEYAGKEVVDQAIFTISDHKDSVYSICVDPNNPNIVVTGGGDDTAYITDTSTNTKIQLQKYKDSVSIVRYNHNGELLAVGTMDGTIRIFKAADGEFVHEFSCDSDLETFEWHQSGNVLLACTTDGLIWMWDVDTQTAMHTIQGHNSPIKQITFTTSGNGFISCDEEGVTVLRAGKTGQEAMKWKDMTGHKAGILQLTILRTPLSLMATADEVGKVHIVSLKTGKILRELEAHEDSIESLEFCNLPQYPFLASAGVDSSIKIWNYNQNFQLRSTFGLPDVVTKLVWHPTLPMLISGCNDGVVRVYDAAKGVLVSELTGHLDAILDITVSKDGKYIYTASDDKTAKVFKFPTA